MIMSRAPTALSPVAAAAAAAASASAPSARRWRGPPRHDQDLDANIRNFAPVARIMKLALPDNAKIAKEAKECMQECVSEFISFITSEGELIITSCLLQRGPLSEEGDLLPSDVLGPRQRPRNASRRNERRSTARTSSSP